MDAFLGEVRAVGFNFAPRNWAICNGAMLPIRANTALFSLLGTAYGGDGKTTFALPDLRGRAVVNAGQGPGLALYPLGMQTGTETVTLDQSTSPPHLHQLNATLKTHSGGASNSSPANAYPADTSDNQYAESPGTGAMTLPSVKGTALPAGGGQAHSNLMPYLVTNYIICLSGIFPTRS